MTYNFEPFEKTVSEINERFKIHGDEEDNWRIVQSIVHNIGGNAVNVGGTTLSGDQPGWGRSSMSDAWLEKYQTQKYHLVDPARYLCVLLCRHICGNDRMNNL